MVSIINVIEEITSDIFPFTVVDFASLFFLERKITDPSQTTCNATISLAGNAIGRATMQAEFAEKLHTRIILKAQGLRLERPGMLDITLAAAQHLGGQWSIPVHKRK